MRNDIMLICEDFQDGKTNLEMTVTEIIDVLNEQIKDEIADQKYETEQEQAKDLFHSALATGKPDLFSDELRNFWDN